MKIDELLRIVQKTNPEMTEEELIYQLSLCKYSTKSLIYTENCCKQKSDVIT